MPILIIAWAIRLLIESPHFRIKTQYLLLMNPAAGRSGGFNPAFERYIRTIWSPISASYLIDTAKISEPGPLKAQNTQKTSRHYPNSRVKITTLDENILQYISFLFKIRGRPHLSIRSSLYNLIIEKCAAWGISSAGRRDGELMTFFNFQRTIQNPGGAVFRPER